MVKFEPFSIIQYKDLYIRIDKLLSLKECNVPNCKCTDCYDIQYEQPEGLSFMGGTFCERHLKLIFNISPSMKETNRSR